MTTDDSIRIGSSIQVGSCPTLKYLNDRNPAGTWVRYAPDPMFDDNGMLALLNSLKGNADAQTKQDTANAEQKRRERIAREAEIASAFPLKQVLDALEREEALLSHLNANGHFYRYALLTSRPSENLVFTDPDLAPYLDNTTLGLAGDLVAVPVRTERIRELDTVWARVFKDEGLFAQVEKSEITLPTNGLSLEQRLGQCDGCEDYIDDSRALELQRLTAEVQALELENQRRSARLGKTPPDLSDPSAKGDGMITVRLEQQPS